MRKNMNFPRVVEDVLVMLFLYLTWFVTHTYATSNNYCPSFIVPSRIDSLALCPKHKSHPNIMNYVHSNHDQKSKVSVTVLSSSSLNHIMDNQNDATTDGESTNDGKRTNDDTKVAKKAKELEISLDMCNHLNDLGERICRIFVDNEIDYKTMGQYDPYLNFAEIDDACLIKIPEMEQLLLLEREDENVRWELERQTKVKHVRDPIPKDEALDMQGLCDLLERIPDWTKIDVTLAMTNDIRIFSKKDKSSNKSSFLSQARELSDNDIEDFSIYPLDGDSKWGWSFGSPPWYKFEVCDSLSEIFPETFEDPDARKKLVNELTSIYTQSVGETCDAAYYKRDLVSYRGTTDVYGMASFCCDTSKSSVLCIGGESGSGKTVFATRTLRDAFDSKNQFTSKSKNAFIYHRLTEYVEQETDEMTPLKLALKYIIKVLRSENKEKNDLCNSLFAASRIANESRSYKAKKKFDRIWNDKFNSPVTIPWWKPRLTTPSSLTQDGLVILIDDVGKDIDFAHGIVEIGREIITGVIIDGKAKKCVLVLVGNRLDSFIRDPNLPIFGTDPSTSKVTVMGAPNKDKLRFLDLPPTDIDGAYTRVLSENTGMLMKGIVPLLKSEMYSEYYTDQPNGLTAIEQRTRDRQEAGSFQPHMSYICREYMKLIGLLQLSEEKQTKILLDLFQYFFRKELMRLQKEYTYFSKTIGEVIEPIPNPFHPVDYLFTLGLAMEKREASNAMKLLSCDYEAMPIYAGDGILLEELLSIHLLRYYSLYVNDKTTTFSLSAAWPPSAPKGLYKEKRDGKSLSKNLFINLNSDEHDWDVTNLGEIVKQLCIDQEEENGMLHIVIEQTVATAQGVDVLVLHVCKKYGTLDFFKVKNQNQPPSDEELKEWMYTLGLDVEFKRDDKTNATTVSIMNGNLNASGYTYENMIEMTAMLSNEFGIDVTIGKRILVVEQEASLVNGSLRDMINATNLIDNAVQKVYVWTSEFLEPTFSAVRG